MLFQRPWRATVSRNIHLLRGVCYCREEIEPLRDLWGSYALTRTDYRALRRLAFCIGMVNDEVEARRMERPDHFPLVHCELSMRLLKSLLRKSGSL